MANHRHQKHQKSNASNELKPEVAEVLNSMPKGQRKELVQALVQSRHSGPLPDAETIRVYAEVIPDGGDRLMTTVEKQLEHRLAAEKYADRRAFNQASTGQWMGFLIAIVFGLIAWHLISHGYEIGGTILGSVDLVALVAVFITGRR